MTARKKTAPKKTSKKTTAKPKSTAKASEDKIPTPAEFVGEAISFAEQSSKQFNLACVHLQDGAAFFSSMDAEVRREWIVNINKFIEQAQFGISSFTDELRIALNVNRAKQIPSFAFACAATPQNIPKPESTAEATVEDSLRKTLSLIGFALQTMASHEFPGSNAKVVSETIQLLDAIRHKVNLDIESLKQKEAA